MQSLHTEGKTRNRLIGRLVLRLRSPRARRGRLEGGALSLAVAVGRAGTAALKREGDGATPRGRLRILGGFYRPDRLGIRPASAVPLRPLRPDDAWCDAPGHAAYNRRVRLPFQASHERLWRDDRLYDILLVLDWNYTRRGRGRGSAIFFHVAAGDFRPTAGCLAVSRADLIRLLALLGPDAEIVVP